MSTQIFDVNPYENHPELTQAEAQVLWEYAKLNQRLKIVRVFQCPHLPFLPIEIDLLQDDRGDQTTQPGA